jgi:hypothetical protein
MKRLAFAALMLATLAIPAAADDAPKVPRMASDPAYFACEADTDCAAANPPCGYLKAFNRQYRDEVQAWYNYVRPKSACGVAFDSLRLAPVCERGRCTMKQMDKEDPSRDAPNYCEISDHCVVVTGRCGVKISVNKWHAAETQEKIGDPAEEGCRAAETRAVVNLRCENHMCRADFAEAPAAAQQGDILEGQGYAP